MTDPTSTVEAVRTYLDARQADPRFAAHDAVAAAAAVRLAAVLDQADSGSGAANASRELRCQLELLRRSDLDPLPTAEELREQRAAARSKAEWADIVGGLGIPVPPSDGEQPPTVQAP